MQFRYTVYDAATGMVLRSGRTSTLVDATIQASEPGEALLLGQDLESGKWRIVDGEPIPVEPPPPPPVTIDEIKAEQGRRLRYTDWAIARAADPTDGRPVPEAILAERAAIRAGASALEAMDPIPPDYRDEKYWR